MVQDQGLSQQVTAVAGHWWCLLTCCGGREEGALHLWCVHRAGVDGFRILWINSCLSVQWTRHWPERPLPDLCGISAGVDKIWLIGQMRPAR